MECKLTPMIRFLNFEGKRHHFRKKKLNPIDQRRIKNLAKHLKWSFLRNNKQLSEVNYFRKKLHLRCLTRL